MYSYKLWVGQIKSQYTFRKEGYHMTCLTKQPRTEFVMYGVFPAVASGHLCVYSTDVHWVHFGGHQPLSGVADLHARIYSTVQGQKDRRTAASHLRSR